ncbi:hypothetical protein PHLCEN_2v3144 [Hermanssonia centrifuga]|uniref:G-alpha-domain-containing protein n=1 Tax=Hermanssonia centrifuga TaxID=98765 RepID=A0A2R6R124_9APHY|nr:hypothetical protein PHLCEN_2v3144 [Hermanssonia centrifuga]
MAATNGFNAALRRRLTDGLLHTWQGITGSLPHPLLFSHLFTVCFMPETGVNQWPPPSPILAEGELQSALRTQEEKEAKRINDEIDRQIELERQELKKRKPQAKILLLGQSEAGKSTLLKNFQLHFAPKAFEADGEAWRAVIHLNLVRAVNFILEALATSPPPPPPSVAVSSNRSVSSLSNYARPNSGNPFRHLRMRLSPLRQVELILTRRLCPESLPDQFPGDGETSTASKKTIQTGDVTVRARSGWKSLNRMQRPTSTTHDELYDARQIIEACCEDIVALWADDNVQAGLLERDVSLEDNSAYFLECASRIASSKYLPEPNDILRARLQTIGVEEHRLTMETVDPGQEWTFYDVEGCRGQRAAWAPYFDDVNAMIFLCPMANFDRVLAEDPTVNSLLDSFQIWKTICESKLLADATFILFLNKMDLLKVKLNAGYRHNVNHLDASGFSVWKSLDWQFPNHNSVRVKRIRPR